MFIPIVYTKIKENDSVILVKDLVLPYGIFTQGHIFTIKSILEHNYYLVTDNDVTIKVESYYFSKNVTSDEAIQINRYNNEKKKILSVIFDKCKMRSEGWDEYERYNSCKLMKSTYLHNDICSVKLSCIKYCDDQTSKKLNVQIRSLKINNIKKRME